MPQNVVLERVRAEYLEMPGLRLTLHQAGRLCGLDTTLCKKVLDALVGEGFLCVKANGTYARQIDEGPARPRVARAELKAARMAS